MDAKDRMDALIFSTQTRQYEFYDGGMDLNLKANKLTYKCIQILTKMLEKIDGFKMIDLSH